MRATTFVRSHAVARVTTPFAYSKRLWYRYDIFPMIYVV